MSYYLLVIHAGQVARTHAGSGIILVQLRELAKRKMWAYRTGQRNALRTRGSVPVW